MADLAGRMQRFPQVLENVVVRDRASLDTAPDVAEEIADAIRSAEAELDGRGRVLVRPSGTEPLIRVMVEAATEDEARSHADAIAEVVRRTLG